LDHWTPVLVERVVSRLDLTDAGYGGRTEQFVGLVILVLPLLCGRIAAWSWTSFRSA